MKMTIQRRQASSKTAKHTLRLFLRQIHLKKTRIARSFLTFLKAAAHGDRVKDTSRFEPEIYYYMVPAGLDIIFQDEDGTEITRVGKNVKGRQDHASYVHTKNIPIVVQDISGNELFRSNLDQGDPSLGIPSPNHTPWKTVIVDEKGKQIPLKYAERNEG